MEKGLRAKAYRLKERSKQREMKEGSEARQNDLTGVRPEQIGK